MRTDESIQAYNITIGGNIMVCDKLDLPRLLIQPKHTRTLRAEAPFRRGDVFIWRASIHDRFVDTRHPHPEPIDGQG